MNDKIKSIFTESIHRQSLVDSVAFGCWALCDEDIQLFAEALIKRCGYHADIFNAAGCPVDMDPTETKPSDYIKRNLGIE